MIEEPEADQDNNGQEEDATSDVIIIPSISAEDATSDVIIIPDVSAEDATSDVIIIPSVSTTPVESEDETPPVSIDLVTGKVQFQLTKKE